MTKLLRYDPSAALPFIDPQAMSDLIAPLEAARDETYADVALLRGGQSIPPAKEPLDSGFIDLPQRLLDEYEQNRSTSLVGRMLETAQMLREELDRLVVLGIGGSYMGLRALFEALGDRYHNELARSVRGAPRLYFDGNNVDNDVTLSLVNVLQQQCQNPQELAERWGTIVISKSGGTLETAAAFRIFRQALERYYGASSAESRKYVVPVTGEAGKLAEFSRARGYPAVFPIPDGVGGRFSVLTAVGLLPAAALGMDIVAMLEGALEMTEHCRQAATQDNPVLHYTAICHLLERDRGLVTRVLSTWGSRLEATGLWYDQLLAESLGKAEKGAFPLTAVNTRDLHSRGQQHQEGVRDKLITNLYVTAPAGPPLELPAVPAQENQDQLNKYAGKTYPTILKAALEGTNRAYADARRPTADLVLPELSARTMGALFQFFMLATVVEGRLIGINPYGQPGVEAYKQNMNAILSQTSGQ